MSDQTQHDRYASDVQYRRLVDTMLGLIVECQFSPSEMREAATLASIRYEMMSIRQFRVIPTGVSDALKTLETYRKSKNEVNQ